MFEKLVQLPDKTKTPGENCCQTIVGGRLKKIGYD